MKRKIVGLALQGIGMAVLAVGLAVIAGALVSNPVGWGVLLSVAGVFLIVQGALAEVGD